MKKYNILKLIAPSVLALFASCELNQYPTDAITSEQAFESVSDAEKFANGLNSLYRSSNYGIFSYTAAVQGDMFNAALDFGNNNGQPHRSDQSFNSSDYSIRDIWRPNYKLITNANNLLENIDQIPTETDEEKAALKVYKGMAHFYRAAMYHDLVRRFAKPYDPATATTQLGVPVVLVYDLEAKPARSNMKQVYDQILADLQAAETGLAAQEGVPASPVPTIDAVKALKARVSLYMRDYETAAALAKGLIDSGKYPLSDTKEKLVADWLNDAGSESIMQLAATETENGPRNNIYIGYNASIEYNVPMFIPTQAAVDMFEETDFRHQVWFKTDSCKFGTIKAELTLLNKYPGNPALYSGSVSSYAQKIKTFRIAEMYLVAAEAYAMSNNAGSAKTMLNALQTARAASLSEGTMDAVKAEWAKEMIAEGWRTDCLKRWGDGFNGRIPQDIATITTGVNYQEKVINQENIYFFSWPIPAPDMDVNPNLVQDEEWGRL